MITEAAVQYNVICKMLKLFTSSPSSSKSVLFIKCQTFWLSGQLDIWEQCLRQWLRWAKSTNEDSDLESMLHMICNMGLKKRKRT